jgi:hypothetical protein
MDKKLYNELVKLIPQKGQAEYLQPELVRQIDKLKYEATNNGNINWDKDFEFFLNYIEKNLPKSAEVKASIKKLKDFENPCVDDAVYETLTNAVLNLYAKDKKLVAIKKLDINR